MKRDALLTLSLRTKTIVGVALIAAILFLILITTVFKLLNDLVDTSVDTSAQTTTNLFVSTAKNAFLSYDLASLEADATEMLSNPNISYVRVLDNNNNVYVEKGEPEALSHPFQQDSDVMSAVDGIYDTAADIKVGETLFGRVEIGLDVDSINQSVKRVRTWTLTLAAIELGLIALCSYLLGSYLMSQLKLLRAGTRHLGAAVKDKNYQNISVKVRGKDELSELAEAFNQLVELLKEENTHRERVEGELKELNSLLEVKVKQRTSLLNQKNFQLEEANKDLKEAQVQLLQAEKMASVGQLAAGVAHEINNPIGFVNSNMHTLSEYVSTYQMIFQQLNDVLSKDTAIHQDEAIKQLRNIIQQQDMEFINSDISELITDSKDGLIRVAEIVKGLKLFSRVDSDEMQSYNLNDCVRTTLAMVNNQLKYICSVETHLGSIPHTMMNMGKISQVVTNLLINAGQAIESTGVQGAITITTREVDGYIELSIQDTGCGIQSSHLDKLFNPFFTTKPEGQGTGLGLSISFGIAQEHGGTLHASSKDGEGSCFTLCLPIHNPLDDNAEDSFQDDSL
ncbi:Histidine kinase [Alteromonas sp. 38]|uniref:HAMP domain-containing sensor histidine kinase n=1 Tax=Alteromonas TaxID=226 RepID=UPI0012F132A4|nr:MULTISPECIES: ATP-binding protein [Alteromonas]CAD5249976.1 Histidine kinase [Alteromonas sp. 154]VXC41926.1 Histidine kinase [Alteromonas sp. 38]